MAAITRKACQKDVSTGNASGDRIVPPRTLGPVNLYTISSWPVTVELIRNICGVEIKQRQ